MLQVSPSTAMRSPLPQQQQLGATGSALHAKTEPGTAVAAAAAPSALVVPSPQPQQQVRRGIQPTHARMRLNLVSTPSSAPSKPKANGTPAATSASAASMLHTPTNGRTAPSNSPAAAAASPHTPISHSAAAQQPFASAAAAAQRSPSYSSVRQALAAAAGSSSPSPAPAPAAPSSAATMLSSPLSARFNRVANAAPVSAPPVAPAAARAPTPHIWQPISVPLTSPVVAPSAAAAAPVASSVIRSPGAPAPAPVKYETATTSSAVARPAFPSPLRAALAASAASVSSALCPAAAASTNAEVFASALIPQAPVSPVLEDDDAFPSLEDDDDAMHAAAASTAPAPAVTAAVPAVSPFVWAPPAAAASVPAAAVSSASAAPAPAPAPRSFFDEFDDGDDVAMAEAAMSAQLDRVQEQRAAAAAAAVSAVASPARVKMEAAAARLAATVASSSSAAAASSAAASSSSFAAAAPASSAAAAVAGLSSAAAAAIADFSDLPALELEEMLSSQLPAPMPPLDTSAPAYAFGTTEDEPAYLHGLNAEQRQAVLAPSGPLLILACAGSGKTKTIERRIMHLIVSGQAQANQILAITFTKKAATELRDRVNRAMDAGLALTAAAAAGSSATAAPALSSSRDSTVCNFHQLALRTVSMFWREAGFPVQPQVLGKREQRLLLLEVLRGWRAEQDRIGEGSRAARRMHNEIIAAITSDRVLGTLLSEAIQKELAAASSDRDRSGAPRSYHPNSREAKMIAIGEDPERAPFTAPRAAQSGAGSARLTQTQGGGAGKDPLTREEHSIIGYFLAFIRRAKTAKNAPSHYHGAHRAIYEDYMHRCEARGLIELDDLVSRMIELLDQDDRVRAKVQQKYRHILVDEYQDVNAEQFLLLRILGGLDPAESVESAARKPPPSIACVGDDDQSIYSWRGSLVHSFLLFTLSYPSAHSITLSRTYRHTQTIVSALSSLIANNKVRTPKALTTFNPVGVPIEFMMCNDTVTEARRIAAEIRRVTGSAPEDVAARAAAESAGEAPKEPLLRLKDIAILSRTRRPLELLHKVLTDQGIACNSPSITLQQSKELERDKMAKEKASLAARKKHAQALKSSKLVMDVLSYAELIASAQDTEAGPNSAAANALRAADPSSDLAQVERKRVDSLNQAFRRVVNLPRRGIGRATLTPVEELAAKWNVTMLRSARVLCGLDPHARKFAEARGMNASAPKLDAKHRDLLRPFLEMLVKFQRMLCPPTKADVPLSVTELLSRLLDKKLHSACTKAEEEEPLDLLIAEARRFDRENAAEIGDPSLLDLDEGMVAAAASQAAQVAAGKTISFVSASAAAAASPAAAAAAGASRDSKRKLISIDSDDDDGAAAMEDDDFMEQKSSDAAGAGSSGKKQKQEHHPGAAAAASSSAAAHASPSTTVSPVFSSAALQSLRTFIREIRAGGSFGMITPNSTTTGGGSTSGGAGGAGGKDDAEGGGGANCVWLNTIHQSKGLEWPMVFLVSFNDGHMPLPTRVAIMEDESSGPVSDPASSLVSPSQQAALLAASAASAPAYGRYTLPASPALSVDADEEERRLAYVAMSRAKRHLILSCVLTNSDGQPSAPSPFLAEIPENLIHSHNKAAAAATTASALGGGERPDDFMVASKHHAAASAVAASASSSAAAGGGAAARVKTETKPSIPASPTAAVAVAASGSADSKVGFRSAAAAATDDVALIGSARKSKPTKPSAVKSEAGAAASASRGVKAEPSSSESSKKRPVSEALKLSRAARAQAKKDTKERESKPWLADFQSAFESAEPIAPEQAAFLATWNPNSSGAAPAAAAAAPPVSVAARSAPPAAAASLMDEMDDDEEFCLDLAPSAAARSTPAQPPAAASSVFSPTASQMPRSSPPPSAVAAAASKAARLSPAVPSTAAAAAQTMYSPPLTLSAQIAAQRSSAASTAANAAPTAAPPRATNLPLAPAAPSAASRLSSQFMNPAKPAGNNGMIPTLKREGATAPAAAHAAAGQTIAGKENR